MHFCTHFLYNLKINVIQRSLLSESVDFIATKVEILNAETQEYDTHQLIDENELPFTESNPKTLNSDDIDDSNLWIYIKDKYNISDHDQAWRELAMKCKLCNYAVCCEHLKKVF